MDSRHSTSVQDVTGVIVNYQTPDLTWRAVWSLRSLHPHLPILLVDNSPAHSRTTRLDALDAQCPHLTIIEADDNLHHGPGMHEGIRAARTPWILLFDSDCIAYRRGFLEAMLEQAQASVPAAYMIGHRLRVDDQGFNSDSDRDHAYVHPKCALVDRQRYLDLPPFERHGAPCLTNEAEAARRGYSLQHFPVDDYVYHLGRGTVARFGYRLGPASWWDRIRQYGRRFIRKVRRVS